MRVQSANGAAGDKPLPYASYTLYPRPYAFSANSLRMERAMIILWIWLVPS